MSKNWISLHIFYYGDQNDLIVNCVAPVIETLRAQQLIERSFFIRYWLEGPHVRLRLLPLVEKNEEKIKQIAEQMIAAYLKRRPALFEPDAPSLAPIYKDMFISEYGEEKFIEKYGENGTIGLRANNSFHYIEYEPEYSRYGGTEGVELAEWHFDHSSSIIIELLREVNVGVPTILLGTAVQLFLPLFYGFFDTDQAVIGALDGYIAFWQNSKSGASWPGAKRTAFDSYNKNYHRMASELQQRVLEVKKYMTQDHTKEQLTPIEYAWKSHIQELRGRVDTLLTKGNVALFGLPEERLPGPAEITDKAYRFLLGSYVHMTNNRLGISIFHEVYLSYLLKRALEDLTQNTPEVTASWV